MAINQEVVNRIRGRQAQAGTTRSLALQANRYSGNTDINTSGGLLNLAMQQGGRVATVGQELAGDKQSFMQKVMSTGVAKAAVWGIRQLDNVNNLMAGTILSMQGNELSFSENVSKALKEDTQVSSVLFGEARATTTVGKIAEWVGRTAFDTLIDPTTYITFGGSAVTRVTAGKGLRDALLLREGATVGLTKEGKKVLDYVGAVTSGKATSKVTSSLADELVEAGIPKNRLDEMVTRISGGESFESVVDGVDAVRKTDLANYLSIAAKGTGSDEAVKLARKSLTDSGYSAKFLDNEVGKLVDDNIKLLDSKTISPDVSRMVMTQLLEVAPHLRGSLVSKGGVNFFGANILEGLKIRSVIQNTPPLKWADESTRTFRDSVSSLFRTDIKGDALRGYTRIPKEFADMQRQISKLKSENAADWINRFDNLLSGNNFNKDELSEVISSYYNRVEPVDPKLQEGYRILSSLDADGILAIRASGGNTGLLQRYIPKIVTISEGNTNWRATNFGGITAENVTSANKKSRVTFEAIDNADNKILGEVGTDGNIIKTASGTNLRKTSANMEIERSLDLPNATEIAKKIESGKTRIVKSLQDEIDWYTSIDAVNAPRITFQLQKQIDEVTNGNLDNLFINDETGDIFFRRGATVEELTNPDNFIEGFSIDPSDVDWIETFAQSNIRREQQLTSKEFVNDISRFGTPASETPTGYRPLNIDKNFTDEFGEHLVFEEDMAKNLELMINDMSKPTGDTNKFLESYDVATRLFKSSVTSMFPAFNFRNGISNTMNNMYDIGVAAIDPKKWKTSMSIMSRASKITKLQDDIAVLGTKSGVDTELSRLSGELYDALREPVFTDARGINWSYGELVNTIRDRGIAFHRTVSDVGVDKVLSRQETFSEAFAKKGNLRSKINPLNPDNALFSFGRDKIAEPIENHARILNFVSNLEKTGDVTAAAARTQMFLYDYGNLTKFEKNVLRRFVPFYAFCVPDYSEIMTRDGWKTYKELSIGEEVLSINPETGIAEWDVVKELHTFDGDYELQKFENKRGYKFVATKDHRWIVETGSSFVKGKHYGNKLKVKKGYELLKTDKFITSAVTEFPKESILSVKDARLLGWLVTDGYHRWKKNHFEGMIYQSPKKYANEIRDEFKDIISSEYVHPDTGVICFRIRTDAFKNILKHFRSKEDMPSIVTRLNRESAEAMFDAMFKAEGSSGWTGRGTIKSFTQKAGGVMDSFQMLSVMLNVPFNIRHKADNVYGGYLRNNNRLKISYMNQSTEDYSGVVWCPVTTNGTWLMRQNGNVVFTGNTRRNIELHANILASTPGKTLAMTNAKRTFSEVFSDDSITKEEEEQMPSWMKRGFYFAKKEGDKIRSTMIVDDTLAAATDMMSLNGIFGGLNPIVKIPIERQTGMDIFRGKPISEVTNATAFRYAPGFLKDFIGYDEVTEKGVDGKKYTRYVSLRPSNMHLLTSLPPTSRIWSTVGQMGQDDKTAGEQLTRFLTGISNSSSSVESNARREERETKEALEKMLNDANIIYQFKRNLVPKDK